MTDREGLQLDLADLFDLSWTRGGSAGPYQNPTTFRVDKFALDFGDLSCGIEAVWVDDVNTIRPFLLNDEDLLLRKAAAGGRTAPVQNSDATVTFSSGSLITDGVQPGDILVLQDATQAANVFTRFRQIRIDSVTDATHLELATADLAFDAGSPVAVASWKILRGYLTYPDSSSDPTNYPNDGDMYGKASDEDDEYSDASAANVLL
ncbi:MAG: hypothetical protein IPJ65_07245 [Archangiaceae bacterium]|nr:hypothetical protein [Archangiaceae bacterium]